MGKAVEIVTPLHKRTRRDYLERMTDDKVACMKIARKFEQDYWDGSRRFGYGGYHWQPGRWTPIASALIERYGLKPGDRVLDLGCGKGFLLYELQLLMPELVLAGWDRSQWGIEHAHPDFKGNLLKARIQDLAIVPANSYDLVLSLGALHNLTLRELELALPNLSRIARQAYLWVESYRDEQELFNLQCWCLTAETLLLPEDWMFLFERFGYKGDYEFLYFS